MSEGSNIVPLHDGIRLSDPRKQQFLDAVAEAFDNFSYHFGHAPTFGALVIVDDEGTATSNWIETGDEDRVTLMLSRACIKLQMDAMSQDIDAGSFDFDDDLGAD